MAYEVLEQSIYETKVKEVLEWSRTSIERLETDDQNHAYQCASVSMFYGRVMRDLYEVSRALDVAEATAYKKYRDELTANGSKATEKQIDAEITNDEGIQNARKLVNEMKARTITVEGLYNTIMYSKRRFLDANKDRINHDMRGA